jgi:hypothetical protein
MTTPGANGTATAAKINYSLNGSATLGYLPFAGMGMAMKSPEGAYDLTGSTGITFYYKTENPIVLEINLTTITDDCNFNVSLPAATTWTKQTVTWGQFTQYSTWGIKVAWDLTKINKFEWKVQAADGTTGNIWIDEVQIDGKVLTLPTASADKTLLITALATANTTYTAALEGTGNGMYPVGSKATLLTAITAATTVNTNTTATQAAVDAAITALNAAVTTFKNAIIVVDKTALSTAITTATATNNAATEGTGNGMYPIGSKATLLAAITAANTIYTNTSSSQVQINTAIATLNAAVLTFQSSVIGVNKSSLVTAISSAQSTYNAAQEGSANGQYPIGSKATLLVAINAATAVNTNASATQAQVNAAISTLNAAVLTFQNSVIGVNKSALVTAISSAQSIYNTAVEGAGNGQYPVGAKATLLAAINAATVVNTNTAASQTDVTNAITTLNAAVTAFQSTIITVDKAPLISEISTAQTVYNATVEGTIDGQYPIGSKAILLTAINNANTVNSNATATQTEVNTATATLAAALTSFENEIIKTAAPELSIALTSVYPNPCNAILHITSGKTIKTLTIVSILGKTVYSSFENDATTSLNLTALTNGMYFVSLQYSNGSVETISFIKK